LAKILPSLKATIKAEQTLQSSDQALVPLFITSTSQRNAQNIVGFSLQTGVGF